jgi:Carboxypeptidase regulatory-like domain
MIRKSGMGGLTMVGKNSLMVKICCAVVLVSGAQSLLGQDCKEVVYANEKQVETMLIELRKVSGTVIDPLKVVIPQSCLGIFTEADHRLLKYVQADNNGYFQIDGLPDGEYRLVGQSPGFCPANARIRIKSHTRKKRVLVVHMNPRGIHCGSYADLSKK